MLTRLIIFILCVSGLQSQAQPFYVEGVVTDAAGGKPIPYAKIYNKTSGKGTISNYEGQFKIEVTNYADSLFVSFTGYTRQHIKLDENDHYHVVKLSESSKLLNEISVFSSDDPYLVNLIADCKKKQPKQTAQAKTYYQLRSFIGETQVELIECFYNGTMTGYDIDRLDLKAGRLALHESDQRFFVSLESSRAITMLKLFEHNNYFPKSPLELSKKEMKALYDFQLINKYNDEENDTILVIRFIPGSANGTLFEGRIWLDPQKRQVEKINLVCVDAIHPFLPLFRSDTIKNVSLDITKTFREKNGGMFFSQVDFNYHVNYKNEDNDYYEVHTNAILYAYDEGTFNLPKFSFSDINIPDYRKINALPYNDFFWRHQDEFQLADYQDQNKKFYNDSFSITNQVLFRPNSFGKHGMLEHPYIHWSEKRITFRETIFDTTGWVSTNLAVDQYKLNVKLFADANFFGDSIHVLTATVFDPYESFYYLSVDQPAICFINVYFDLMEIERQKLQKQLQDIGTEITAKQFELFYTNAVKIAAQTSDSYLKAVDRGRKKDAMIKWNEVVKRELGIDNIEIFQPYKESQE